MNIVYLHGFGSDSNSEKGVLLTKHFGKTHTIITPSLSGTPSKAIDQIHSIISKEGNFVFVGTSLGGFYADYFNKLADIPCVLINPLVEPNDTIHLIGKNKFYYSGKEFEFTQDDIKFLEKLKSKKDGTSTDSPEYIILAKDDELIDYKKSIQYFNHDNQVLDIYDEGGHRFMNNEKIVKALDLLLDEIGDYDFNLIEGKNFVPKRNLLNEHYINLFKSSAKEQYWPEIKDLLDKTYAYVGGFTGDYKEFFQDNHLWKLIRKNGKIITGTIYKDRLGRKGVCGFTDGTAEGKMAFKTLMKEDIKLNRSWAEVSDKMEIAYKRMGSIPLPHSIVKIVMDMLGKEILNWNEDGYHYTRMINGVIHEKVMYGKVEI